MHKLQAGEAVRIGGREATRTARENMGKLLGFLGRDMPPGADGPLGPDESDEVQAMPNQARNKPGSMRKERWLRLQAVQVITMLPDDPEEAQKVLDYAQTILTDYLNEDGKKLAIVKRD